MKLKASGLSILLSIFRLGLLRLSAGTYEATSSTAANVIEWIENRSVVEWIERLLLKR